MIFYFSATGNNKYIAESIARAAGDTAVSVEGCKADKITLKSGESLGFVSPTYFLELPPNVKQFIENTRFEIPAGCYVYGVVTYGTTSGGSGGQLKSLLHAKDIKTNSLYSILTPDTWTPVFDLSDADAVRKRLEETSAQLKQAAAHIAARENGDFRKVPLPCFITAFSDISYQKARTTSHFSVADTCIGCGLCAKSCPVSAIEMRDGRPAWAKEKCLICLRCLHSCPKFSISYGVKTAEHGQYRAEKYLRYLLENIK